MPNLAWVFVCIAIVILLLAAAVVGLYAGAYLAVSIYFYAICTVRREIFWPTAAFMSGLTLAGGLLFWAGIRVLRRGPASA